MTMQPLRRRFMPGAKYVLPSERIEVNRRLHWSVIIPDFLLALLALFLAGYVTGQMTDRSGPLDDIIWLGALTMIGRLLFRVAEWNSDRFIVTERRMILVTGVFSRRVAMMPLVRVTDMTYNRSVAGRLFGWGTFVVESAGQDQALRVVDRVPSPDRLYRTVCELMFGTEDFQPTAVRADESDPRLDADDA